MLTMEGNSLADGLPGAPVGFTGNDVVNFGTATRQAFSKVTGFYTDFPQNNSMSISNANIVSYPVFPILIYQMLSCLASLSK
jgi:hypothetical protein